MIYILTASNRHPATAKVKSVNQTPPVFSGKQGAFFIHMSLSCSSSIQTLFYWQSTRENAMIKKIRLNMELFGVIRLNRLIQNKKWRGYQ